MHHPGKVCTRLRAFGTIHPGHIRYLRHASGLDEQLVVALIGDDKTSYPFHNDGLKPSVCLALLVFFCCKPMN